MALLHINLIGPILVCLSKVRADASLEGAMDLSIFMASLSSQSQQCPLDQEGLHGDQL